MEINSESQDDHLDTIELFESADVSTGAPLNKAAQSVDGLTHTSFNNHSDSDNYITDKKKENTNVDVFDNDDDDEYENHHSLPMYPPLDAYTSATTGQKRLSSIRQSLCGKSCALRMFLVLTLCSALIVCSIAFISTNRKGALSKKSPWWPSVEWATLPAVNQSLYSLAFGSCSDQTLPMTYWDTLSTLHPDITILMGDNVYGECDDSSCETLVDASKYRNSPLKEAYDTLASDPSFQRARANLPMIATLDNHDYGRIDANENNPMKDEAKEMFLDFFAVPSNDERRRLNDGVYTSYEWGPEGQKIQVILLDVRYFHSEFKPTDEPGAPLKEKYIPDNDPKKRFLSQKHWKWLEQSLARPANVRLVISSIQVMADGHGFECWRMIPHERTKLYNLLQPTLAKTRTIILSGDRHVGGFYKHETEDLYEVTASSWTHTIPYGKFDDCSNAQECDEIDPRRMDDFVRVNHFGVIHLDWDNREMFVGFKRVETLAVNEDGNANFEELLQPHVFSIP